MELHVYWKKVLEAHRSNPNWRYGQAAFNVLAEVRPDLSEQIRGETNPKNGKDPFYIQTTQCPNWLNFVQFLKENW